MEKLLTIIGFFFWFLFSIFLSAAFKKTGNRILKKNKSSEILSKMIISPFNIGKFFEKKKLAASGEKAEVVNPKLDRHKKYLQIALNSSLKEAGLIISQLPKSDRILIEAGTPLIKKYGMEAISEIRNYIYLNSFSQNPYIVADLKCADMGKREVNLAAQAGARASTCLGVAPIETIDEFIQECKNLNIDSMVDMMNVDNPLLVMKKLKNFPDVVIIHRGVDETEKNKEKLIPYYQINQIKGNCDTLISIAGGDTVKEIQSAVFNGANIVVLWKAFYKSEGDMALLVKDFLKEVR